MFKKEYGGMQARLITSARSITSAGLIDFLQCSSIYGWDMFFCVCKVFTRTLTSSLVMSNLYHDKEESSTFVDFCSDKLSDE